MNITLSQSINQAEVLSRTSSSATWVHTLSEVQCLHSQWLMTMGLTESFNDKIK